MGRCWAAEPTLARLSFWVPPEQVAEFETVYQEKVLPFMEQHGLKPFGEQSRATPDSIFTRLFEFKTPEEARQTWRKVSKDSTWGALRQDLGKHFRRIEGPIRFNFTLYSTPAGVGREMPAEPREVITGERGKGHWRIYDVTDGLGEPYVSSIFQDQKGVLWFGTGGYGATGYGVSRYDGQVWTTFTKKNGLASDKLLSIIQDREGHIWFGTQGGGVSRYDGRVFTTYTTKDGLAHQVVTSIVQDGEGDMWFGTFGGVSRYDGQDWTTFGTQDGLAYDRVRSIVQDQSGALWFGTEGGGVSCYDGQTFQTLTRWDGLGSNVVTSIVEDRSGVLWFGTTAGVTRFLRPVPASPSVAIEAVVAGKRYTGVDTLAIPSTVQFISFEFAGFSFKTRPDGMVYRYRLRGYDEDWKTTRKRRVEYQDLTRGSYTFEIQAVDRDLTYSKSPGMVQLTVHPPYGTIALMAGLGIAVIGMAIANELKIDFPDSLRNVQHPASDG